MTLVVTLEQIFTGPTDPSLSLEIASFPGAESIRKCIQCGVCTGSCPMAHAMPEPPRRILAHVLAGDRERAVGNESIWYCASCFTCSVRCPQGVSMADVMFALRSLSMDSQKSLSTAFYQRFTKDAVERGRIHEAGVAMVKVVHGGLTAMLREAPLGVGLLRRGRMPFLPHRIKGADQLRSLALTVGKRSATRRKEAEEA